MTTTPSKSRFKVKRVVSETPVETISVAHDRHLDETVFLKKYPLEIFQNVQHAQACQDRMRAIAQQEFLGVAPVREVTISKDRLGVVVGGSDGTTLREVSDNSVAGKRRVLQQLKSVAAQLDQLHNQSIVHGNIRPESLCQVGGGLILTEFASLHAILGWTANQRVVPEGFIGPLVSVTHTAPEIKQGASATPASDQFALAVTIIECLAGTVPGENGNVSGLRLPEAAKEALAKALSSDPTARFIRCSALLENIEAAFQDSGRSKIKRLVIAACLVLPLVSLPMIKKTMAVREQARLNAAAKAQHDAAFEKLKRESVVTLPDAPASPTTIELPLSSIASAFDEWKAKYTPEKSSSPTPAGTPVNPDLIAYRQYVERFRNLEGNFSVDKPGPNQTVIALASTMPNGAVRTRAIGRGDSTVRWEFEAPRPPAASWVPVKTRVQVLTNESTAPKIQEFTLRSSMLQDTKLTIDVDRPRQGEWTRDNTLNFEVHLWNESTKGWEVVHKSLPFWVARLEREQSSNASVVCSDVVAARKQGWRVASSLRVGMDDAFKITAEGSVVPWSDGSCDLLSIPKKTSVNPEGITAVPQGAKFCKFVRDDLNWGALLVMTDGAVWAPVTAHKQFRIAGRDVPNVGLSINSVIVKTGSPLAEKEEKNFWRSGSGVFNVTLIKRPTSFPLGVRTDWKHDLIRQMLATQ